MCCPLMRIVWGSSNSPPILRNVNRRAPAGPCTRLQGWAACSVFAAASPIAAHSSFCRRRALPTSACQLVICA
eukprot:5936392-Amphidinium_carterae.7